ncbi:MAG: endonuclease/exonuclease/phosphatase family protein [Burkholderiaceae bacterium]
MVGNHFSSKGSDPRGRKRIEPAGEVVRIASDLRKRTPRIVVAGDSNDYPAGGSLDPLVKNTKLTDARSLPVYSGRPGTYKTTGKTEKIDYLLISPALSRRVKAVDVNRKGYFSTLWGPYEEIKNAAPADRGLLQASDHHCL